MVILTSPTDSAFTQTVINQVNARLPDLTPGEEYTLDQILGNKFWDTCAKQHKAMGVRFSGIVKAGRTPFESTGLSKDRHNKYCFTG